ncbi:DUF4007 family protein [Paraglaciecola chathamensis]|uniref:DUF4007 family protein n=1 Tax=Paraglaciecola chathamensis TaxID=368405 RepID=UPI0026FD4BA1|nr:DUF4007 family protein [Paraglaciecola chathamensis]MDO6841238.1 DUF4007 family protein [Paraglaciecola chathamensis]
MKAKFSGHDTFPLRYGWLYKSVNHLKNGGKLQTSNEEYTRKAIVDLGVGKNMVNAMKYWVEASSFATSHNENNKIEYKVTRLGEFLFGNGVPSSGVDPYLEKIGSIWLVHFLLNFNYDVLTAYRYFFNYSNTQNFDKKKLLDDFAERSPELTDREETNLSTLKKDLDCFLNTYGKKQKTKTGKKVSVIDEDYFSSPLSELNLLNESSNAFYISELGERASLPIEIFIFALIKFINKENAESGVDSIEFDALLHKPCSPGRIFRLSDAALGHKLDRAQEFTGSDIKWTDSLGLRQVRVNRDLLLKPESFIYSYYGVKRDY